MPTLDDVRKKKFEELVRLQQQKGSQQSDEQSQIQQQIEQMESVVKKFFTKDALERYGNLKAAHQEKSIQLLVVLFQAIQKGQVQGKIEDDLLKKILQQMTPEKKDFKISRV
ncbi:MAG TPA: DNA-binding protein [Candidatus Nanoarchaeia archaeon]|nr:DNA-binding protein [Candidatus Nanoarchaeia archaeon]